VIQGLRTEPRTKRLRVATRLGGGSACWVRTFFCRHIGALALLFPLGFSPAAFAPSCWFMGCCNASQIRAFHQARRTPPSGVLGMGSARNNVTTGTATTATDAHRRAESRPPRRCRSSLSATASGISAIPRSRPQRLRWPTSSSSTTAPSRRRNHFSSALRSVSTAVRSSIPTPMSRATRCRARSSAAACVRTSRPATCWARCSSK
jgi:hypothetical protein